jgi:hypothetical protein
MPSWIDEGRKRREIEAIPKYGPINPLTDRRCFVEEATDELLDGLNYLEWAMNKGEITFCEWAEIDEFVRIALSGLKDGQIRNTIPQ